MVRGLFVSAPLEQELWELFVREILVRELLLRGRRRPGQRRWEHLIGSSLSAGRNVFA